MRKYLSIYSATLLSELQYFKGIILSFIGDGIHVLIFFLLWKYLYQSGGKQIINGYSLEQMIWYVTFTELLTTFSSSGILRKEPSRDITNGNIAYLINKPYSYTGYVFSKYLAESTVKGIVKTICFITLGIILIGPLQNFNFLLLPLIFISLLLGSIIAALIRLIISYTSFWVENSEPFQWLFKTLFLIFGVTFPIEMFPKILQPIIRYSPIYAALSGPCKMVINFNFLEYFFIIILQVLYILIFIIIIHFEYKKGAYKLNVNGG